MKVTFVGIVDNDIKLKYFKNKGHVGTRGTIEISHKYDSGVSQAHIYTTDNLIQ